MKLILQPKWPYRHRELTAIAENDGLTAWLVDTNHVVLRL